MHKPKMISSAAALTLCLMPTFVASTRAAETCVQKSVQPMSLADFGWVRGVPSLSGNGLWKLSQGSTVQWCGLIRTDFRGITWAWVSFKSVQEPWDQKGWMSSRILSPYNSVQSTPAPAAPVASVPIQNGRSAYVPPAGYTLPLTETPASTEDRSELGRPQDIPAEEFREIRSNCATKWSDQDYAYTMRADCEKTEFDAIRKMRSSNR